MRQEIYDLLGAGAWIRSESIAKHDDSSLSEVSVRGRDRADAYYLMSDYFEGSTSAW